VQIIALIIHEVNEAACGILDKMSFRTKYLKIFFVGVVSALVAASVFMLYQRSLGWTNPTENPPAESGSGIIPAGMVMFYSTASTCPTGWAEYTEARGLYVVSLNSGGTLASTVGTVLSNAENRAVGQHTHAISDPTHTPTVYGKRVPSGTSAQITYSTSLGPDGSVPMVSAVDVFGNTTTGITITASGTTAGTNAPYIQLLVCKKS